MKNKHIIITLGVMSIVTIAGAVNKLRKDVKKTNSTLERIAKHIGVPEKELDFDEEKKCFLKKCKKDQVIKKHRDITGDGLKEAKEHVDSLVTEE